MTSLENNHLDYCFFLFKRIYLNMYILAEDCKVLSRNDSSKAGNRTMKWIVTLYSVINGSQKIFHICINSPYFFENLLSIQPTKGLGNKIHRNKNVYINLLYNGGKVSVLLQNSEHTDVLSTLMVSRCIQLWLVLNSRAAVKFRQPKIVFSTFCQCS